MSLPPAAAVRRGKPGFFRYTLVSLKAVLDDRFHETTQLHLITQQNRAFLLPPPSERVLRHKDFSHGTERHQTNKQIMLIMLIMLMV